MPRALTSEQIQYFHDLANSENPEDRLKAAKSRRCPPELLTKLTTDVALYSEISRKAWANPNLPVETMRKGVQRINAGGLNLWGTYSLYHNKNLPPDLCVVLSRKVSSVYSHPNFPLSVMRRHYNHTTIAAKKSMAKNKNLTQEMQTLLAWDTAAVRRALAKNKHISQETVDILATCDSPPVLRNIIDHPLAEKHRETILARLSSEEVFQGIHTTAAIARHTQDQNFVADVLKETDHPVIQKSIFTNKSLDERIIEESCYSEQKEIRSLAVKHPKCSETGKVAAALLG